MCAGRPMLASPKGEYKVICLQPMMAENRHSRDCRTRQDKLSETCQMLKRLHFAFDVRSVRREPHGLWVEVPSGIASESELMSTYYRILSFPDYFGANWAAMDECLGDLSWLKLRQVVLVHDDLPLQNDREALSIYLSVLDTAVERWQKRPEHKFLVVFPAVSRWRIRRLMWRI